MQTNQKIDVLNQSDGLTPCGHMVDLVSRRSDDTLAGPAKWYTDFHILTCPQCKSALKGLRELRVEVANQVRLIPTDKPRLNSSDWKVVEEALAAASSSPD
jgi:uncharacterized protein YbaR (Trm112 family)